MAGSLAIRGSSLAQGAIVSSDFTTRRNAPGVVYSAGFDTQAEVDQLYINSQVNGKRGFLDSSVRCGDGGSLRMELRAGETTGDISGKATTTTNPWGMGGQKFSQNSTFYLQYATRLSSTMVSNLSQWNSTWKNLILFQNNNACATLDLVHVYPEPAILYTSCGQPHMFTGLNSPDWDESNPPTMLIQQDWNIDAGGPPWTREAGGVRSQYQSGSYAAGTWFPAQDEWYYVYLKVHVGTLVSSSAAEGPKDSTIEMWIKELATTSWKKVQSCRIALGYNAANTDGFNNWQFGPFMTGLTTSATRNAYVWYDELIISTLPIAMPGSTAPTWFANQIDKTWVPIASNTIASVKPNPEPTGNTQNPSVCSTWNGAAVLQGRRELVLPGNGGHHDYGGNEVYTLNLGAETPAWLLQLGPSAPAVVFDASGSGDVRNSSSTYSDGKIRSDHTYNIACGADDKVWKVGQGAMYGATGNDSSAVHYYDRSANSWNYVGIAIPSVASGWRMAEGSSAFDPITRCVYSVTGVAGGSAAIYRANIDTNVLTNYSGVTSDSGRHSWCTVVPQLRMLVVGTETGLYYIDLDNPSTGFHGVTAGGQTNKGPGWQGHYHRRSHAIFSWNGNGSSIVKMPIPGTTQAAAASATWTSSLVTASASNTITPSGSAGNGVYTKFNLIEDMGNGQSALVLVLNTTGDTWVYKIPVNGM